MALDKARKLAASPEIAGLSLVGTSVKLTCRTDSPNGVTNVFMSGEVTRTYSDGGKNQKMNFSVAREAVICPANDHKLMKERGSKGVPYRHHQPGYRNT